MKRSPSQNGFTLVEIMIVLSIIGMLAIMATPGFLHAREMSRRSICINNLRMIDAAKEQYALINNQDSSVTPVDIDILGFIRTSVVMPVCPAGGTYAIEAIDTMPTCSESVAPNLHVL